MADGIVACFAAGTLIETAQGARPVETLKPGDLLVTRDHGLQPLVLRDSHSQTQKELSRDHRLRPIAVEHAGHHVLLSRQHTVLMSLHEGLVLARAAHTPFASVQHVPNGKQAYHHLLMPKHVILCANGLPCESLLPGPLARKRLPPIDADLLSQHPTYPILNGAEVRAAMIQKALQPAPWMDSINATSHRVS